MLPVKGDSPQIFGMLMVIQRAIDVKEDHLTLALLCHSSSSASHHNPPGSLVLSPQQPFHWPQLKHFHLANHHSILNPQIGQCGISVALLGSTIIAP